MKKLIVACLMLFSMIGFGMTVQAQTLPDTLIVHYFRYDEDYTNFNMWIWENEPTSKGGIQHDFDGANVGAQGVFHVVNLTTDYATATKLGIIIKQGSGWQGYQEIGGDRFIDLNEIEVIDGVANAYFVEQDIRIGLSQDDLENNIPDYRHRILTVFFDTQKRIRPNLTTTPVDEDVNYWIYENGVLIQSGKITSQTPTITVTSGVDISKAYELEVEFEDNDGDRSVDRKRVSMQNLYDTAEFESLYSYTDTLGVSFEEDDTVFRLWAPLSEKVELNLYHQGHPMYDENGVASTDHTPYLIEDMYRIENGAWETRLTGDHTFKYYTFSVTNNGITYEVTDPYAYSTGANGLRGMIVDFSQLNPEGWAYGTRPDTIERLTDYIVYELHVRDLTTHSSWTGTESYRGKFLGLTERGTTFTGTNDVTVTTGLDHLIELGVNAVQLLPIFDFGFVDEVEVALNPSYLNVFNWGYMPYHFNTLEGSYATNPFDGRVRIEEFKEVVMAFHENDIRIIMDVVYNHTGPSADSNFHRIVPGYYHRMTATGGFSNGSGTGNETASERSMMRKFMLGSIEFWATEYNLSGFRFDLMELHDVDTMNQIQTLLEEIDTTIIVYGEPWMGGDSPLSTDIRAGKTNLDKMNNVGAFNDVTRDAIKGSVFTASERGWVQNITNDPGRLSHAYQGIRYGVVGGINYPGNTTNAWHLNPNQTINYVTAHDNHTLNDKLRITGITNVNTRKAMQIQSNAIVLTSQGIPFLHAGVDFMRSKPNPVGRTAKTDEHLVQGFIGNSYESPDVINQLRWDQKALHHDVFEYYKALIAIRKAYTHFRMDSADDILTRLTFLDTDAGQQAVAYKITGLQGEPEIIVVHSGSPSGGLTFVALEEGKEYLVLTNAIEANPEGIEVISDMLFVPANTTMILVEVVEAPVTPDDPQPTSNTGLIIAVGASVLVVGGGGAAAFVLIRKRKLA